MNKIALQKCSKCNGDGNQYAPNCGGFFGDWRKKLGLTQDAVCEAVGISDKSQLSRFEHNKFAFSEQRLRTLAQFYSDNSQEHI